jgi:hypothetical protein
VPVASPDGYLACHEGAEQRPEHRQDPAPIVPLEPVIAVIAARPARAESQCGEAGFVGNRTPPPAVRLPHVDSRKNASSATSPCQCQHTQDAKEQQGGELVHHIQPEWCIVRCNLNDEEVLRVSGQQEKERRPSCRGVSEPSRVRMPSTTHVLIERRPQRWSNAPRWR